MLKSLGFFKFLVCLFLFDFLFISLFLQFVYRGRTYKYTYNFMSGSWCVTL